VSRGIGLDFGTTNSAIAISRRDELGVGRHADPATELVAFPTQRGDTMAFRSVLYFGRDESLKSLESSAGPRAIERYLEDEEERRLMQSLKSFLASRLFKATNVLGRNATLEELVGRMLRPLRERIEAHLLESDAIGEGGLAEFDAPIVVGRPVRFAKAKEEADDDFAVSRLRDALERADWPEVHFEYEPVAAAYHYEQGLTRDELVLIADFGGGTSDFCLLRVGPTRRERGRAEILGTIGVALAGDAFDAKIVREVVAPRLGKGSLHRTPYGSEIPVPKWIYTDLERWHHLSFLRSRKTLGLLHDVLEGSQAPDQIRALLHLIEADLGFQLYRAVEQTKRELSSEPESWILFDHPPAEFEIRVTREEFEGWIADELAEIEECVNRLLAHTQTTEHQVDRVFMTGGSSFVPAVRRIFERRFGGEKLRGGGELVSVASGLSLRALDLA
jgi:hypothetical chaperone protein